MKGLLALCQLPAATASTAHLEAAGALHQLANQPPGKEQLLFCSAAPVLAVLLTPESSSAPVMGNALAAVAHACTHCAVNSPGTILQQAATGFVPLQDQMGASGVVAKVVAVCEGLAAEMHGQVLPPPQPHVTHAKPLRH